MAAQGYAAALFLTIASSALADVHYVDVNSTNATPPYTNWATAATNIGDAVVSAVAGDEVVVTNGIYSTGGDGLNRVVVSKPLNVRSVNGPQFTTIDGGYSNRCVALRYKASLSGFTLVNGYIHSAAHSGAPAFGGGAYGYGVGTGICTLNNCVLTRNKAEGIDDSQTHGGGAYACTLNDCTLTDNSAYDRYSSAAVSGGGAYACTLNNCTLSGNTVDFHAACTGGGAAYCTLNNCTLADNAAFGGTSSGGGAFHCTLNNCIAYFNVAGFAPDYDGSSTLNYCCTRYYPLYPAFSGGIGNITNPPLFVDTNGFANLRLQSNSPCINAGNNSYVTNATDLDVNPRIAGGTVDIGAYEFQAPASSISYAWLQQFNLPINPATDTADPDGDGVDNWREWLAGTNPTNALSSPAQLTITSSGTNAVLKWSTNAVGFSLQCSVNPLSPSAWLTNSLAPVVIGGQNVVTNRIIGPQQFYRLSN